MLVPLRDYIRRENRVSTQQMSREFQLDLSALQPMLDFWVKKGVIAVEQKPNRCQSACSRCHASTVVFYMSQN